MEPNHAVRAAGGQELAVLGQGQAPKMFIGLDLADLPAVGDVEVADDAVMVGGDQSLSVGGDEQCGVAEFVGGELEQLLAGGDVPEPSGAVVAGGGERLVI